MAKRGWYRNGRKMIFVGKTRVVYNGSEYKRVKR